MQQPGAFSAIFLLAFVWVLSAHAQSRVPQTSIQQRAHDEYERHKQAAIRINELARQIHSESDATTLVSEIAALFADELPQRGLSAASKTELPTPNTSRFIPP